MVVARIVLGIGSSHTPQVSSSAAGWSGHADRDRANSALLGADGKLHSYDELLASAPPGIEAQLTQEVWAEKWDRTQRAIETLAKALEETKPDVVVVIGDDQKEMFGAQGFPALGLFTGEQLWDLPPGPERLARMPADILPANWAAHAEEPEPYPVAASLSRSLAEALAVAEFDCTISSEQAPEHSLGHAFTFVRRRLGLARTTPLVPVFLNTYFPPNVPSPGRAFRLGEAIRAAVLDWPQELRVAVVASGGLSHFVVLEEFDRAVLDALGRRDAGALSAIPRAMLRTGTSETLNWITAAGALGGLAMEVVDYVPGYRSPAGTGCGMAFALWS
jgi:hypothetical protein